MVDNQFHNLQTISLC